MQTFEVGEFPNTQTVHFPKSCLHCEDPPCVPVCPTGASYKRAEDGIVLVDYDKCIGCKYCAWACPYGVRELDEQQKVMTKCTLCVDRINDADAARGRPQARLRDGVPDQRAALRRHPRSGVRGLEGDPRATAAMQLMPEWGTQARQPLPAAAQDRDAHPAPTSSSAPTTRWQVDGKLPKPAVSDPSLDDVTSW